MKKTLSVRILSFFLILCLLPGTALRAAAENLPAAEQNAGEIPAEQELPEAAEEQELPELTGETAASEPLEGGKTKSLFTLFIATDRHGSSKNLKAVLETAADYAEENYSTGIGATMLGGDMADSGSYKLTDINSEIQEVLGSDFTECYYTYGSHDSKGKTDGSNGYLCGAVDLGACYLYGVSYDGMTDTSTAKTEAEAFTEWIKTAEQKPVIVMSHVPLHQRRGDNEGASTWVTALNDAADTHDIIVLWGHNHTGESSADTAVYYVAKGGKLTPGSGSKKSSSSAVTIRFSYANAGYITNGYGSNIVITDTALILDRFSTTGLEKSYTILRDFPVEEPKQDVTVVAESEALGYGGVALLSGGGVYKEGDEVTLTAEEICGAEFLGWFREGSEEPETTEYSLTIYPEEDCRYLASYRPKRLSVNVDCEAYILKADGQSIRDGEELCAFGEFTLLYTGSREFLGWADENGNLRCSSACFRFVTIRDITICPIYSEAE